MAEPFAPVGAVQCAATSSSATYALPNRLAGVIRYYVSGDYPAWVKIVDTTAFNTYNHNANGAGGEMSYPRIGFYHFGSTWNASFPTIEAYMTNLFFGVGASLFNEAEASLAGL